MDKRWIVSNFITMFSAYINEYRSGAYSQGNEWLKQHRMGQEQNRTLRDPVNNFTIDEFRYELSIVRCSSCSLIGLMCRNSHMSG